MQKGNDSLFFKWISGIGWLGVVLLCFSGLAFSQAKFNPYKKPVTKETKKTSQDESQYTLCYNEALELEKPLVVFVKCTPFRIKGAIVHHMPEGVSWLNGSGIVVSRPKGDWMEWVDTLPETANGQDVIESLKKKTVPVVQPVIAPVFQPYVQPSFFRSFSPSMGGGRSGGSC